MSASRYSKIETGMHFDEVKRIFGEDIWQNKALGENTWLVNNETDKNPTHGYSIAFDAAMRVKSKGMFSCS